MKLAEQECEACRPDSPRLSDAEIAAARDQIPEWRVTEREGVKRLERAFRFSDFAGAMAFSNRVAGIAEQEGHHPAILTQWGRVTVTWWTHAIKGLHRNDVIMAAKTDQVYGRG